MKFPAVKTQRKSSGDYKRVRENVQGMQDFYWLSFTAAATISKAFIAFVGVVELSQLRNVLAGGFAQPNIAVL